MPEVKTIYCTLCGLKDVYIINAPVGYAAKTPFLNIPPELIDRRIAAEIIQQKGSDSGPRGLVSKKSPKDESQPLGESFGHYSAKKIQ